MIIMRTVDLILRKRGGEELGVEELQFLVNGYTSGDIPDYQMSAFLMATYFSGMTDRELSSLTEVMMGAPCSRRCSVTVAWRVASLPLVDGAQRSTEIVMVARRESLVGYNAAERISTTLDISANLLNHSVQIYSTMLRHFSASTIDLHDPSFRSGDHFTNS